MKVVESPNHESWIRPLRSQNPTPNHPHQFSNTCRDGGCQEKVCDACRMSHSISKVVMGAHELGQRWDIEDGKAGEKIEEKMRKNGQQVSETGRGDEGGKGARNEVLTPPNQMR